MSTKTTKPGRFTRPERAAQLRLQEEAALCRLDDYPIYYESLPAEPVEDMDQLITDNEMAYVDELAELVSPEDRVND